MAMGVLGVPRVLGVQRHRIDSRTKRNNSRVGFGCDLWSTRSHCVGGGGRRPGAIWSLGDDQSKASHARAIEYRNEVGLVDRNSLAGAGDKGCLPSSSCLQHGIGPQLELNLYGALLTVDSLVACCAIIFSTVGHKQDKWAS